MQCLFHADKRLVKSLSLRSDRHHNCHCRWSISQPNALLPLMFHYPANSPWYCSKQLQYVSKQCLIGCTPGVHQQLKMLEPKVRIWFVMWEFTGNFDVHWSIPHPNMHINQFYIWKEGIHGCTWHVSTCGHAHTCTNGLLQTIVQLIINLIQRYVSMFFFIPSCSLLPFFPLVYPSVVNCWDPSWLDRPQ